MFYESYHQKSEQLHDQFPKSKYDAGNNGLEVCDEGIMNEGDFYYIDVPNPQYVGAPGQAPRPDGD